MILATKNDALWDEIGYTPAIDGGIGPIAIGDRATMIDDKGDTWYICVHSWSEVDGAWLEAYTSGENPPITIFESIPETWRPPPHE